MTLLLKPLSFMLVIATTFGVVMHDTQVDKATNVALNPVYYASASAADATAKSGDHVHVERFSVSNQAHTLRSNLPKIQPRDDDRRYIQSKKITHSGNSASLWPST